MQNKKTPIHVLYPRISNIQIKRKSLTTIIDRKRIPLNILYDDNDLHS